MPGQVSLVGLTVLAMALAWAVPIPAVAGEPEVGKSCAKECLPSTFVSRPIPLSKLQSYENITCKGRTSVVLLTKMNRSFCARPEEEWVQRVMKQLDLKNAPPPSKADTPGFDKFSRDVAVPPSAPAVGHIHPTGASRGFPARRTTVPDRSPRPPAITEETGVGATFKPGSVANGKTDQTHGSGTPHGLATSPTFVGTQRTTNGRSGVQNPTRSSLQPTIHLSGSSSHIADSVEKGMVPSATPTMFLTSPSTPTSALSTSDKLQTTTGLTNWLQTKGLTNRSSTHSSLDGSNTRSFNIEDRSDGMRDSSVAFGGTSPLSTQASRDIFSELPASRPTSGFHQENVNEKSRAQVTTYKPEVPLSLFPGALVGYRTHIISLVGAGLLFLASALVGWLWLKSSLSATTLPKEMVEGLLYNSPNSQADEYPMKIL